METEIWKDIPGYEWRYQINEYWKIQSLKTWKILSARLDKRWYYTVNLEPFWNYLKQITYKIHYLVLLSFKWNRPYKYSINHIDWIKTNNHYSNLEYCTYQENTIHAYRIGLMENNSFKKKHPMKWKFWPEHNRSIPVIQIDSSWIETEWGSAILASYKLGIDASSISRCCKWKQITAWWFTFKYL